jgi:hypothetical protein
MPRSGKIALYTLAGLLVGATTAALIVFKPGPCDGCVSGFMDVIIVGAGGVTGAIISGVTAALLIKRE